MIISDNLACDSSKFWWVNMRWGIGCYIVDSSFEGGEYIGEYLNIGDMVWLWDVVVFKLGGLKVVSDKVLVLIFDRFGICWVYSSVRYIYCRCFDAVRDVVLNGGPVGIYLVLICVLTSMLFLWRLVRGLYISLTWTYLRLLSTRRTSHSIEVGVLGRIFSLMLCILSWSVLILLRKGFCFQ